MESPPIPDERPQRRREYSGAGSTLGLAMLVIVVVGTAIWWFELRDASGSGGASPAGGFGIVATPANLNPSGKAPAAAEGRVAPNFLLQGLDGGSIQLSAFRGRPVLLNFWASWCGPCRAETPDLQRLAEDVPSLVVLGVNQQEDPGTARDFATELRLTYPIALDRSGEVSLGYRIGLGIPVSFLIGPDGVIQHVYPGQFKQKALETLRTCLVSAAADMAACLRSDG